MAQHLDGKVALITGGNSGIGRATALKLAKSGASIVITHSQRSSASAASVVSELEDNGCPAIALPGDLGDRAEIDAAFAKAKEHFGRLDIVVSCAAAMKYTSIADATDEIFDEMFNTNTKGTFFVLRDAAKHLENDGRIVVVSSPGGKVGQAGSGIYGGSKTALESFVRALAWELAPKGISVNTVWPGVTDTKILDDSYREIGASLSPFGRIGSPEDVAGVISLLTQNEAHWLTGQIIQAGGGATML